MHTPVSLRAHVSFLCWTKLCQTYHLLPFLCWTKLCQTYHLLPFLCWTKLCQTYHLLPFVCWTKLCQTYHLLPFVCFWQGSSHRTLPPFLYWIELKQNCSVKEVSEHFSQSKAVGTIAVKINVFKRNITSILKWYELCRCWSLLYITFSALGQIHCTRM